jgi:hypothetical protein
VAKTAEAATSPVTTSDLDKLFLRTAPFQHVPSIDVVNTVLAAVEACIGVANNSSVHAEEYRRAMDASRAWVDELKASSERFMAKAVDAPLSAGLLNLLAESTKAMQDEAENVRTASAALVKLVPEADVKDVSTLESAWDKYGAITSNVTRKIRELIPVATGARFKDQLIGQETSIGCYAARVESEATRAGAIIETRAAVMSKASESLAHEVKASLRALAKNYEFEITSEDRRRMAAQSEAIRGGRALVRVLGDLVGSLLNKKPVIEAAFNGEGPDVDYIEPLRENNTNLLRIIGTTEKAARVAMAYAI